jgi:hypothetical protein
MIEQLAGPPVTALPSIPGSDGIVGPLAQASGSDVERFRAAMISPQGPVAAPELQSPLIRDSLATARASAGSPPVAPTSLPGSGGALPSIGESIISGLRSVSDDTRMRYRQIAEVLSDPAPTISDLMSLQFVILQNSLQFDLTSKLISKAPQSIDSILKTQ